MNEELQNELVRLIEGFTDTLKGTADFAVEQAPDVIQQLLTWHMARGAFAVLLGALVVWGYCRFVSSIFSSKPEDPAESNWAWQGYDHLRPDMSVIAALGMVFGGIGTAAFLVVAVEGALVVMQIWIAPKVYLLEYAADLVK